MFVKHNPKPAIAWETLTPVVIERVTSAVQIAWADFLAENGTNPAVVGVDDILDTSFWSGGPSGAMVAVDEAFFALLAAMDMQRFKLRSFDTYDARAQIEPVLADNPPEGLVAVAYRDCDFPDFEVFCTSLDDAVRIRLGVGDDNA